MNPLLLFFFFFSSRRRHTRSKRDWSSDVCSSDLIDGIADNQRGLDQRQSHQYGQHLHGPQILIGQKDFDGGHHQKRAPNPEEQPLTMMSVLFGNPLGDSYLNRIHIPPVPRESWRTSNRPRER